MKKFIFSLLVFLSVTISLFADKTVESGATVTSVTSVIATADPNLKDRYIVNSGGTACFLSRSGTAVAGQGIYLPAGAAYPISSTNTYRGAIAAITASGSTTVTVSTRTGQ
jgi:hypothetical protein